MSVPSIFSQLYEQADAFSIICNNIDVDDVSHKEAERKVSHCLDLFEMIRMYGSEIEVYHIDGGGMQLLSQSYPNSQLLSSILIEDSKNACIGGFLDWYLFTWQDIVLGGISPMTVLYTNPNVEQEFYVRGIRINGVSGNSFFCDIVPLIRRDVKFREFMYYYRCSYSLPNVIRGYIDCCMHMDDYWTTMPLPHSPMPETYVPIRDINGELIVTNGTPIFHFFEEAPLLNNDNIRDVLIDTIGEKRATKDEYLLNTDNDGNHRIAFTNKRAAIAVGNILKMREEIENFVHVFKNDILSVDSFGDEFVVLLSDKQVVQLHGDVEIELFKDIRAKSIACGLGGIYALDENGFVHAEYMVNNLALLNELKTWNNIKQISAGPNILAGVTQGGKVLMFSMSNLLEPGYIPGNYRNMSNHFTEIPWTSLDGWTDVVKVFVTKDFDKDQPNVVYGITRFGKILIGGRVWFDKYEYYKEMVGLRNVTDLIEDGMTTLVRFNDGKIKLCCYHSEMYYEEQLAFLKKHYSVKDISMKGKFNFVAIDVDEKIHLMYGYQEQDWEYWGY